MEKITVFSGMRGNNYMAEISSMSCDHVVNVESYVVGNQILLNTFRTYKQTVDFHRKALKIVYMALVFL